MLIPALLGLQIVHTSSSIIYHAASAINTICTPIRMWNKFISMAILFLRRTKIYNVYNIIPAFIFVPFLPIWMLIVLILLFIIRYAFGQISFGGGICFNCTNTINKSFASERSSHGE